MPAAMFAASAFGTFRTPAEISIRPLAEVKPPPSEQPPTAVLTLSGHYLHAKDAEL